MNRKIIYIPSDGSHIEICGHIIDWEYGWEEFLEYLKRCELAIDKATPKKVNIIEFDLSSTNDFDIECPTCGGLLGSTDDHIKVDYCWHCGQALDWSEGE